jgi:hypothetical protein
MVVSKWIDRLVGPFYHSIALRGWLVDLVPVLNVEEGERWCRV